MGQVDQNVVEDPIPPEVVGAAGQPPEERFPAAVEGRPPTTLPVMEEQIKQLVAQVQLLIKEAERSQAATTALENQRFTDMQRTLDLQAQVITMATAAAASSKPQLARVTFVDTKGIGKPATFGSELEQFPTWSFKLGNFLEGILKGMKDGLE